jgi:hypothetical protein
MSRPLAYKNPNLDGKLNPQEISTPTASGWRRKKPPEMTEMFRLIVTFLSALIETLAGQSRRQTCPASIAVEREGKEWLDHHRESLRLSRQRLLPAD